MLATLPSPRPDLLVFGFVAAIIGMLWRPWVGPALVGAALPFYFFPQQLGRVAFSPPGLVLALAWLSLLLGLALRRWRPAAPRPVWPWTGYDEPLALFLVASLLSLLVTEYPLLSVRELRALIFEPVLFFWLLAAWRRQDGATAALGGFLLAASIAAAAAIAQSVLGTGGTEAEGVRRAQAWYPQPNHLALMLGRALPFFLAALLTRTVGGPASTRLPAPAWFRLLASLGAVASGWAIVLTFSLGAWVGAIAAVVVLLAALRRRRAAVAVGAATVVTFLLLSSLAIVGRVPERLNPLRQTTGFRVDLWQSSIAMVVDHPLLGVGLDNFVYQYQQVYLREGATAESNLSHPHNWVLHVWLELGLLGLAAFIWLLVRFWRAARDRLRHAPADWTTAGATAAMADLLVHGLMDNSYFLVDLAFTFWLLLALVALRRERAPREAPSA